MSNERPLFPWYTLYVMVMMFMFFGIGLAGVFNRHVILGVVFLVLGFVILVGYVPFTSYLDEHAERTESKKSA